MNKSVLKLSISIFYLFILFAVITPTNAAISFSPICDRVIICKQGYENYKCGCVKECEFGSIRNQNGICEKIIIPQSAELLPTGRGWKCINGYEKINNICLPSCGLWKYREDNGLCVSVEYKEPPEGEFVVTTKGACPMGYIRKYKGNLANTLNVLLSQICNPIILPEHSSYFDDNDKGWKCNDGFLEENNKCICVSGKKIIAGKCVIEVLPSKEYNRSQLIQKIKELLLKIR